jgi:hypothetical protein
VVGWGRDGSVGAAGGVRATPGHGTAAGQRASPSPAVNGGQRWLKQRKARGPPAGARRGPGCRRQCPPNHGLRNAENSARTPARPRPCCCERSPSAILVSASGRDGDRSPPL